MVNQWIVIRGLLTFITPSAALSCYITPPTACDMRAREGATVYNSQSRFDDIKRHLLSTTKLFVSGYKKLIGQVKIVLI